MKRKIFAALLIAALTAPAAAYAAPVSEGEFAALPLGTSKSDVHASLGNPETASVNGVKEVYRLTDGGKAVLIYSGGHTYFGFIVH